MSSLLLIKSCAFDSLKSSKVWPMMVPEENEKNPEASKTSETAVRAADPSWSQILKFCGLPSERQVGIGGA